MDSLHSVKSRPAKVGDKLTTHDFGTGTRGFAASEDVNVAVCVLPGTELSFADEIKCLPTGLITWRDKVIDHKTAIFRQINKDKVATHHDALEFPDGRIALLSNHHLALLLLDWERLLPSAGAGESKASSTERKTETKADTQVP